MLHSVNGPAPTINEHQNLFPVLTKSFSNGLVPVFENENGDLVCDARKLHRRLKTRTQFNKWVDRKLLTDDFQEGEDFWSKLTKSSGGRKPVDYELTIDTAKELAMMERNEEGRKVRRYFIQLEKAFKAMVKNLFTPVNGVMPIHQAGKIGIPRKEFLISIRRSYKNGYRLRRQYPNECFDIGRTSCISLELAHLLLKKFDVRQLEMDLFNAQNSIG